jgi:hypothetical protein
LYFNIDTNGNYDRHYLLKFHHNSDLKPDCLNSFTGVGLVGRDPKLVWCGEEFLEEQLNDFPLRGEDEYELPMELA